MFGWNAKQKAAMEQAMEHLKQDVAGDLSSLENRIEAALLRMETALAGNISALEKTLASHSVDMEKKIAPRLADTEDRLSARLADAENRLDERLSGIREAIDRKFSDMETKIRTLCSQNEAGLSSGFSDLELRLAARLSDTEGRVAASFARIETKIEEKPDSGFSDAETRIAAHLAETMKSIAEEASNTEVMEAKVSVLLSEAGHGVSKKLSEQEERVASCLAAAGEKFLAELAEAEKKIDANLSGLEEKTAELADRLQRFCSREDERRPMIETVLENQERMLDMLNRMGKNPPMEALMSFAENFALSRLEGGESDTPGDLSNRLDDLLACFGLSLITDRGTPFDSRRHVAAQFRYEPESPENFVLQVVRPGFLAGGTVLRPAAVVVNSALPLETSGSTSIVPLEETLPEKFAEKSMAVQEGSQKKTPAKRPVRLKNLFLWLIFGTSEPKPQERRFRTADRRKRRSPTDL